MIYGLIKGKENSIRLSAYFIIYLMILAMFSTGTVAPKDGFQVTEDTSAEEMAANLQDVEDLSTIEPAGERNKRLTEALTINHGITYNVNLGPADEPVTGVKYDKESGTLTHPRLKNGIDLEAVNNIQGVKEIQAVDDGFIIKTEDGREIPIKATNADMINGVTADNQGGLLVDTPNGPLRVDPTSKGGIEAIAGPKGDVVIKAEEGAVVDAKGFKITSEGKDGAIVTIGKTQVSVEGPARISRTADEFAPSIEGYNSHGKVTFDLGEKPGQFKVSSSDNAMLNIGGDKFSGAFSGDYGFKEGRGFLLNEYSISKPQSWVEVAGFKDREGKPIRDTLLKMPANGEPYRVKVQDKLTGEGLEAYKILAMREKLAADNVALRDLRQKMASTSDVLDRENLERDYLRSYNAGIDERKAGIDEKISELNKRLEEIGDVRNIPQQRQEFQEKMMLQRQLNFWETEKSRLREFGSLGEIDVYTNEAIGSFNKRFQEFENQYPNLGFKSRQEGIIINKGLVRTGTVDNEFQFEGSDQSTYSLFRPAASQNAKDIVYLDSYKKGIEVGKGVFRYQKEGEATRSAFNYIVNKNNEGKVSIQALSKDVLNRGDGVLVRAPNAKLAVDGEVASLNVLDVTKDTVMAAEQLSDETVGKAVKMASGEDLVKGVKVLEDYRKSLGDKYQLNLAAKKTEAEMKVQAALENLKKKYGDIVQKHSGATLTRADYESCKGNQECLRGILMKRVGEDLKKEYGLDSKLDSSDHQKLFQEILGREQEKVQKEVQQEIDSLGEKYGDKALQNIYRQDLAEAITKEGVETITFGDTPEADELKKKIEESYALAPENVRQAVQERIKAGEQLAVGNFDEGISTLKKVREIGDDAQKVEATSALANAYINKGDLFGAKRELSSLLDINSNDVTARNILAGVYRQEGNLDEALQQYNGIHTSLSDLLSAGDITKERYDDLNKNILKQQASTYQQKALTENNFAKSNEYLSKARGYLEQAGLPSGEIERLTNLNNARSKYNLAGSNADKVDALEEVLKYDPGSISDYREMANLKAKLKDYSGALDNEETAQKILFGNLEQKDFDIREAGMTQYAFNNLVRDSSLKQAIYNNQLGNHDLAINSADFNLALDKSDIDAQRQKVIGYFGLEQGNLAEESWKNFRNNNQGNDRLYAESTMELMGAQFKNKNYDDMLTEYKNSQNNELFKNNDYYKFRSNSYKKVADVLSGDLVREYRRARENTRDAYLNKDYKTGRAEAKKARELEQSLMESLKTFSGDEAETVVKHLDDELKKGGIASGDIAKLKKTAEKAMWDKKAREMDRDSYQQRVASLKKDKDEAQKDYDRAKAKWEKAKEDAGLWVNKDEQKTIDDAYADMQAKARPLTERVEEYGFWNDDARQMMHQTEDERSIHLARLKADATGNSINFDELKAGDYGFWNQETLDARAKYEGSKERYAQALRIYRQISDVPIDQKIETLSGSVDLDSKAVGASESIDDLRFIERRELETLKEIKKNPDIPPQLAEKVAATRALGQEAKLFSDESYRSKVTDRKEEMAIKSDQMRAQQTSAMLDTVGDYYKFDPVSAEQMEIELRDALSKDALARATTGIGGQKSTSLAGQWWDSMNAGIVTHLDAAMGTYENRLATYNTVDDLNRRTSLALIRANSGGFDSLNDADQALLTSGANARYVQDENGNYVRNRNFDPMKDINFVQKAYDSTAALQAKSPMWNTIDQSVSLMSFAETLAGAEAANAAKGLYLARFGKDLTTVGKVGLFASESAAFMVPGEIRRNAEIVANANSWSSALGGDRGVFSAHNLETVGENFVHSAWTMGAVKVMPQFKFLEGLNKYGSVGNIASRVGQVTLRGATGSGILAAHGVGTELGVDIIKGKYATTDDIDWTDVGNRFTSNWVGGMPNFIALDSVMQGSRIRGIEAAAPTAKTWGQRVSDAFTGRRYNDAMGRMESTIPESAVNRNAERLRNDRTFQREVQRRMDFRGETRNQAEMNVARENIVRNSAEVLNAQAEQGKLDVRLEKTRQNLQDMGVNVEGINRADVGRASEAATDVRKITAREASYLAQRQANEAQVNLENLNKEATRAELNAERLGTPEAAEAAREARSKATEATKTLRQSQLESYNRALENQYRQNSGILANMPENQEELNNQQREALNNIDRLRRNRDLLKAEIVDQQRLDIAKDSAGNLQHVDSTSLSPEAKQEYVKLTERANQLRESARKSLESVNNRNQNNPDVRFDELQAEIERYENRVEKDSLRLERSSNLDSVEALQRNMRNNRFSAQESKIELLNKQRNSGMLTKEQYDQERTRLEQEVAGIAESGVYEVAKRQVRLQDQLRQAEIESGRLTGNEKLTIDKRIEGIKRQLEHLNTVEKAEVLSKSKYNLEKLGVTERTRTFENSYQENLAEIKKGAIEAEIGRMYEEVGRSQSVESVAEAKATSAETNAKNKRRIREGLDNLRTAEQILQEARTNLGREGLTVEQRLQRARQVKDALDLVAQERGRLIETLVSENVIGADQASAMRYTEGQRMAENYKAAGREINGRFSSESMSDVQSSNLGKVNREILDTANRHNENSVVEKANFEQRTKRSIDQVVYDSSSPELKSRIQERLGELQSLKTESLKMRMDGVQERINTENGKVFRNQNTLDSLRLEQESLRLREIEQKIENIQTLEAGASDAGARIAELRTELAKQQQRVSDMVKINDAKTLAAEGSVVSNNANVELSRSEVSEASRRINDIETRIGREKSRLRTLSEGSTAYEAARENIKNLEGQLGRANDALLRSMSGAKRTFSVNEAAVQAELMSKGLTPEAAKTVAETIARNNDATVLRHELRGALTETGVRGSRLETMIESATDYSKSLSGAEQKAAIERGVRHEANQRSIEQGRVSEAREMSVEGKSLRELQATRDRAKKEYDAEPTNVDKRLRWLATEKAVRMKERGNEKWTEHTIETGNTELNRMLENKFRTFEHNEGGTFNVQEGQVRADFEFLRRQMGGIESAVGGGKTSTISPLAMDAAAELMGRKGMLVVPEGKLNGADATAGEALRKLGKKVYVVRNLENLPEQLKQIQNADHVLIEMQNLGFLETQILSPGGSRANKMAARGVAEALSKNRQIVIDEVQMTLDPNINYQTGVGKGGQLSDYVKHQTTRVSEALRDMGVFRGTEAINTDGLFRPQPRAPDGTPISSSKFNDATLRKIAERVSNDVGVTPDQMMEIFKGRRPSGVTTEQRTRSLDYLDSINEFADGLGRRKVQDYGYVEGKGVRPARDGQTQTNQQYSKARQAAAMEMIGSQAYGKNANLEGVRINSESIKATAADFMNRAMRPGTNTALNGMTATTGNQLATLETGYRMNFEGPVTQGSRSEMAQRYFGGQEGIGKFLSSERFKTTSSDAAAVDQIAEWYRGNRFKTSGSVYENGVMRSEPINNVGDNLAVVIEKGGISSRDVYRMMEAKPEFKGKTFIIREGDGRFVKIENVREGLLRRQKVVETTITEAEARVHFTEGKGKNSVLILGQGGSVGTDILAPKEVPVVHLTDTQVTKSGQEQGWGRFPRLQGQVPDIYSVVVDKQGQLKGNPNEQFTQFKEVLTQREAYVNKENLHRSTRSALDGSYESVLKDMIRYGTEGSPKVDTARRLLKEFQNRGANERNLNLESGYEGSLEALQKRADSNAQFYRDLMDPARHSELLRRATTEDVKGMSRTELNEFLAEMNVAERGRMNSNAQGVKLQYGEGVKTGERSVHNARDAADFRDLFTRTVRNGDFNQYVRSDAQSQPEVKVYDMAKDITTSRRVNALNNVLGVNRAANVESSIRARVASEGIRAYPIALQEVELPLEVDRERFTSMLVADHIVANGAHLDSQAYQDIQSMIDADEISLGVMEDRLRSPTVETLFPEQERFEVRDRIDGLMSDLGLQYQPGDIELPVSEDVARYGGMVYDVDQNIGGSSLGEFSYYEDYPIAEALLRQAGSAERNAEALQESNPTRAANLRRFAEMRNAQAEDVLENMWAGSVDAANEEYDNRMKLAHSARTALVLAQLAQLGRDDAAQELDLQRQNIDQLSNIVETNDRIEEFERVSAAIDPELDSQYRMAIDTMEKYDSDMSEENWLAAVDQLENVRDALKEEADSYREANDEYGAYLLNSRYNAALGHLAQLGEEKAAEEFNDILESIKQEEAVQEQNKEIEEVESLIEQNILTDEQRTRIESISSRLNNVDEAIDMEEDATLARSALENARLVFNDVQNYESLEEVIAVRERFAQAEERVQALEAEAARVVEEERAAAEQAEAARLAEEAERLAQEQAQQEANLAEIVAINEMITEAQDALVAQDIEGAKEIYDRAQARYEQANLPASGEQRIIGNEIDNLARDISVAENVVAEAARLAEEQRVAEDLMREAERQREEEARQAEEELARLVEESEGVEQVTEEEVQRRLAEEEAARQAQQEDEEAIARLEARKNEIEKGFSVGDMTFRPTVSIVNGRLQMSSLRLAVAGIQFGVNRERAVELMQQGAYSGDTEGYESRATLDAYMTRHTPRQREAQISIFNQMYTALIDEQMDKIGLNKQGDMQEKAARLKEHSDKAVSLGLRRDATVAEVNAAENAQPQQVGFMTRLVDFVASPLVNANIRSALQRASDNLANADTVEDYQKVIDELGHEKDRFGRDYERVYPDSLKQRRESLLREAIQGKEAIEIVISPAQWNAGSRPDGYYSTTGKAIEARELGLSTSQELIQRLGQETYDEWVALLDKAKGRDGSAGLNKADAARILELSERVHTALTEAIAERKAEIAMQERIEKENHQVMLRMMSRIDAIGQGMTRSQMEERMRTYQSNLGTANQRADSVLDDILNEALTVRARGGQRYQIPRDVQQKKDIIDLTIRNLGEVLPEYGPDIVFTPEQWNSKNRPQGYVSTSQTAKEAARIGVDWREVNEELFPEFNQLVKKAQVEGLRQSESDRLVELSKIIQGRTQGAIDAENAEAERRKSEEQKPGVFERIRNFFGFGAPRVDEVSSNEEGAAFLRQRDVRIVNAESSKIDVEWLIENGYAPEKTFELNGYKYHISKPSYSENAKRVYYALYIESPDGTVNARVAYRSSSNSVWRTMSIFTGNWYGKGPESEESVTFPTEIQRFLEESSRVEPIQRNYFEDTFKFFGGVVRHGGFDERQQVVEMFAKSFIGGQFGGQVAYEDIPQDVKFSKTREIGRWVDGQYRYDDEGYEIDVSRLPSMQENGEYYTAYVRAIGRDAQVYTLPSKNGELNYLMMYDPQTGAVWTGSLQLNEIELNDYGVNSIRLGSESTKGLSGFNLLMPAFEYGSQIPNGYMGDKVESNYYNAIAFTDQLPQNVAFKEALGIPRVPNPNIGPHANLRNKKVSDVDVGISYEAQRGSKISRKSAISEERIRANLFDVVSDMNLDYEEDVANDLIAALTETNEGRRKAAEDRALVVVKEAVKGHEIFHNFLHAARNGQFGERMQEIANELRENEQSEDNIADVFGLAYAGMNDAREAKLETLSENERALISLMEEYAGIDAAAYSSDATKAWVEDASAITGIEIGDVLEVSGDSINRVKRVLNNLDESGVLQKVVSDVPILSREDVERAKEQIDSARDDAELERRVKAQTAIEERLEIIYTQKGTAGAVGIERALNDLFDSGEASIYVGNIDLTTANSIDTTDILGNVLKRETLKFYQDRLPAAKVTLMGSGNVLIVGATQEQINEVSREYAQEIPSILNKFGPYGPDNQIIDVSERGFAPELYGGLFNIDTTNGLSTTIRDNYEIINAYEESSKISVTDLQEIADTVDILEGSAKLSERKAQQLRAEGKVQEAEVKETEAAKHNAEALKMKRNFYEWMLDIGLRQAAGRATDIEKVRDRPWEVDENVRDDLRALRENNKNFPNPDYVNVRPTLSQRGYIPPSQYGSNVQDRHLPRIEHNIGELQKLRAAILNVFEAKRNGQDEKAILEDKGLNDYFMGQRVEKTFDNILNAYKNKLDQIYYLAGHDLRYLRAVKESNFPEAVQELVDRHGDSVRLAHIELDGFNAYNGKYVADQYDTKYHQIFDLLYEVAKENGYEVETRDGEIYLSLPGSETGYDIVLMKRGDEIFMAGPEVNSQGIRMKDMLARFKERLVSKFASQPFAETRKVVIDSEGRTVSQRLPVMIVQDNGILREAAVLDLIEDGVSTGKRVFFKSNENVPGAQVVEVKDAEGDVIETLNFKEYSNEEYISLKAQEKIRTLDATIVVDEVSLTAVNAEDRVKDLTSIVNNLKGVEKGELRSYSEAEEIIKNPSLRSAKSRFDYMPQMNSVQAESVGRFIEEMRTKIADACS